MARRGGRRRLACRLAGGIDVGEGGASIDAWGGRRARLQDVGRQVVMRVTRARLVLCLFDEVCRFDACALIARCLVMPHGAL